MRELVFEHIPFISCATLLQYSYPITDDLVKQGNKERKAKQVKKTKAGKKVAIATPASKAAKKKAAKKAKVDADSKKAGKVAQQAGKSKAQRNAQVAQKRGLAVTGVASVKDIKATIQREALKLAKQMVQKGDSKSKNNNQSKGNNSKGKGKPSIKISFRPSELKKTTTGNVAKQIGAVLSKAPSKNKAKARKNNNSNNNNNNNGNRRVVLK